MCNYVFFTKSCNCTYQKFCFRTFQGWFILPFWTDPVWHFRCHISYVLFHISHVKCLIYRSYLLFWPSGIQKAFTCHITHVTDIYLICFHSTCHLVGSVYKLWCLSVCLWSFCPPPLNKIKIYIQRCGTESSDWRPSS